MHVMSVLLTRHSIEEIMVHVDPVIIDVCDFRRRVNFLFELKLPEGSLHCVKQTVSCLYDLRWKEMRRAWLFIRVSIVSMIPLCRTALRVTTFFINSHKVIINLCQCFNSNPLFCLSVYLLLFMSKSEVSPQYCICCKFTMAINLMSCYSVKRVQACFQHNPYHCFGFSRIHAM